MKICIATDYAPQILQSDGREVTVLVHSPTTPEAAASKNLRTSAVVRFE